MHVRTPSFWKRKGVISLILWPFTLVYRMVVWVLSLNTSSPYQSRLPLLCVGNVVIGGAGKTPTAIALCYLLKAQGYKPAFISRGYGGTIATENAIQVDSTKHLASEVGDEPLLLAKHAPVFIAKERAKAVQLAEKETEINVLIMDDGLQNPSIAKTASLLVMHGEYGIGNGMLFPAGPLREPFAIALKKAQAIIINGDDKHHLQTRIGTLPVFNATIAADSASLPPKNKQYLAFAGIAHPDRFFSLLKSNQYNLSKTLAFADHYPYKSEDLLVLEQTAQRENAELITTEKDWVRLPHDYRKKVHTLPVTLELNQQDALLAWLNQHLNRDR